MEKNQKKNICSMKDELGEKILNEFVVLKSKIYSCLADDGCVDRKVKCTNKCLIKREIKFEDCKRCLESNKAILRYKCLQQMFRSELHNVFTEKINNIVLSLNDDKRI